MSVYDAGRRPLCAVAAPSNVTLKSSVIFWKSSDSVACARSCWNSSDCIVFNVYANGSCELFNRCSYGLFQSVDCCQAFSDASYGWNLHRAGDVIGTPPRVLSITGTDFFHLYFDGIEVQNLPNANNFLIADTVPIPCSTRVIGAESIDLVSWRGIKGSTSDGYVVTNNTWKCSNVAQTGWPKVAFDDSRWPAAVYTDPGLPVSGSFRSNAHWIWTVNKTDQGMGLHVYCRLNV